MGSMTLVQAALCGIIYWLAVGNLPFVGLWSLQRPLVCGALTGLVLGHPVEGAVIGATINLVYLGFMSAGGSMPADMGLAGVLGTAYAIAGGLDTDTALALAVPIGILGTIVWAARMTFDSIFVHMADKYIENEQYNKIWIANVLLPQIMCFCMTAIPCTLAAYFGSTYGVALTAAAASLTGISMEEILEHSIKMKKTFSPRTYNVSLYEEKYKKYKKIYKAMQEVFMSGE